jgi:hypothetical protein
MSSFFGVGPPVTQSLETTSDWNCLSWNPAVTPYAFWRRDSRAHKRRVQLNEGRKFLLNSYESPYLACILHTGTSQLSVALDTLYIDSDTRIQTRGS